jgi:MSHA biogenesis protein MshP
VKPRVLHAGFALMMAVFMIVTLAAIGVYLITVSTGQAAAIAQDEQGVEAYQAARAGLEVGAYQVLRTSICTPTQTITLTNQRLNGFSAKVDCLQVNGLAETEGGSPIAVYRVTSTGCNTTPCTPASPDPTYVERQLQITITR